jgi:hypothetical protein
VVVTVAETATLPEGAPPVLKPVPVQEVAPVEDQETVALPPYATLLGETEIAAVGTA